MIPAATIAILGAGAGSRMQGGDKLLEDVDGQPLLRTLARRALATGCPVIVTLPPGRPARLNAVRDLPVQVRTVADAGTGMSASFRALADIGTDVLVCLGDMPEIETSHMLSLLAARDGQTPVRALTASGRPGQPVLFPAAFVPLFAGLQGDAGARAVLAETDPIHVALPGDAAITDLDTPQAWADWRATRGGTGAA